MSVEYILDRFGKKVGMLPSDTSQRALLLDYVNEAAQELYEQSDMPGSLEEAEFYVQGDKTIAMPSDVYAIRGIREKTGDNNVWDATPLTERYRENSWVSDHNKFRVKGYSPIQRSLPTSITEASDAANKLSFRYYGVTAAAEIFNVTVKTDRSDSYTISHTVSSNIAVNAVQTSTVSDPGIPIKDIVSFTRAAKPTATQGKVELVDYNFLQGIVYAEIPSNATESRYLIVDVSEFPFSDSAAQNDQHTLQVIYKKKLTRLQNDADEFPAPGYDNIIVSKCMELFLEEQGKIEEAILHDKKASRSLARRQADLERGQNQSVIFKRHNHDKLAWLATRKPRL